MSSRPQLVAGNWKMHTLSAAAAELAASVAQAAAEIPGPDIAVFPPYTSLHAVRTALAGSRVALGGQACHENERGAHTGEISARMLADAGCSIVLCGHSERRAAGATDEQVGRRAAAALGVGVRAVVCVGETLEEREAERTGEVLLRQLEAALTALPSDDLALLELAYEPVWAIGTGRTATPEIAAAAHAVLRGRLRERFGDAGREPRILYGGSVKPANAADLLSAEDVGGVLVGGASLDGPTFRAIIEAAAGTQG